MKLTLLDIVQDVLSEMGSDNVNSIADTIESQQVALIARNVYFEMFAREVMPTEVSMVHLDPSNSIAKPVSLFIPATVANIKTLRYNNAIVQWMEPNDFLYMMNNRTISSSNSKIVTISDISGITLKVYNDRDPVYYTSFNEKELFFDAYNATVGTTLIASYSLAEAEVTQDFSLADSFYPAIPEHVFPYFLAEVKSNSFISVKQMPNAKVEQKARELKGYLSRRKHIINRGFRAPSYGRK